MDIFEFAMQMEKDGEQYYLELAQHCGNRGLARIFTMMAQDEVKHYRTFQRMRDQHPEMADSVILKNAKNIFQQLKESEEGYTCQLDQIDHYRIAQELEKKSEEFYQEKAEEITDPGYRAILQRISEEERKHYFLLENIIEFVSRPETWLEDAEFVHLDEY